MSRRLPFPRWPAPIERLAERVNPILVKEVRQALRGRYFRMIFWLTLSGAVVIGLVVMIAADPTLDARGMAFFNAIFACLAAAAHGFVPFSAFVAMGSEWEENTYDLLVLSNLRPRQIVVGKLLSAGAQALLLYSAFGPLLVFAFLLGGIDLLAILVVLGGSMLLSLALSATAIALSCSVQVKFARTAVMAGLAALLVWVTFASFFAAGGVVAFPGELRSGGAQLGLLAYASLLLAYVPLPLAHACARLSHPEENRSTLLRAAALLPVAVGLSWATVVVSRERDLEINLAFSMAALILLALACTLFLTEPLRLGRRARLGVPRSRALALASLPFLPGGVRALLWFLLVSAGVWLWFVGSSLAWPDPRLDLTTARLATPLVAALYGVIYLGLPALLVHEREDKVGPRIAIRLMAPALAGLGVVGPGLVGFFRAGPGHFDVEHAGNPVWVLRLLWNGSVEAAAPAFAGLSPVALVTLAALVVLGLNLPRILGAVRETLAASAARRALRAEAAATAAAAPSALGEA